MTKRLGPCDNCPFRTDITPYIRAARAREIAAVLDAPIASGRGGMFPCHKTVNYDDEDEDGHVIPRTEGSKWCYGALIVMEKSGILDNNQMARISMRIGLLNPNELDLAAPVPDSLEAWIEVHRKAERKAQVRRARRPKRDA